MMTLLRLNQIIGQLTEENVDLLESYAEFLLYRQKTKNGKNGNVQRLSKSADAARLERLRKHAGKAKYPDTPTDKYAVYEQ